MAVAYPGAIGVELSAELSYDHFLTAPNDKNLELEVRRESRRISMLPQKSLFVFRSVCEGVWENGSQMRMNRA
jgi:hypothetical protein